MQIPFSRSHGSLLIRKQRRLPSWIITCTDHAHEILCFSAFRSQTLIKQLAGNYNHQPKNKRKREKENVNQFEGASTITVKTACFQWTITTNYLIASNRLTTFIYLSLFQGVQLASRIHSYIYKYIHTNNNNLMHKNGSCDDNRRTLKPVDVKQNTEIVPLKWEIKFWKYNGAREKLNCTFLLST